MSASRERPPLGRYRDIVTELLEAGRPFREIERAIGNLHELDENEQSALWLFAFFSRPAVRRPPPGRTRLASVG